MTSTEFTKRLLSYRLSLLHLSKVGLKDVYSHLIAAETGYSAALIRKDFSRIQIKGKRRGGYEINVILDAIDQYFGDDKVNEVVLVGMGDILQPHMLDLKLVTVMEVTLIQEQSIILL